MLAIITVPAGDAERHHHAVARFEFADCFAHLDHFPHEFVPENVPRLHAGDIAMVEVQIGAADGRRTDFDNGVPWIQDFWIRHCFHPHVLLSVPTNRSHFRLLLLWAAPTGCPSVVGISPVSISALNRPRSSSTWMSGSSP